MPYINKKSVLVLLFILASAVNGSYAQGILGKLKQKAQQIGEKIIDKKTDEVLNGKKPETPQPTTTGGTTTPNGNASTSTTTPPIVAGAGNETVSPAATPNYMIITDTLINGIDTVYRFNTSSVSPKDFVSYALTLKGTPYVFGSTDPQFGLDCSGFITHVFNHFNISVPRRTFDFKNAEKKVTVQDARPGDIILFTGIDPSLKVPGHMGIITAKGKDIQFIHASSGQKGSVTTAMLSYSYFKPRLLQIVRVFD